MRLALFASVVARLQGMSSNDGGGGGGAATAPVLIDFRSVKETSKWVGVDDRIMGGSSTSRVGWRDGFAAFEGDLIVQGGGFASCRRLEPLTLADPETTALELEAASDGRMGYKLTLTAADGVSYQALLPQLGETFETVRLPLASFRPTFRGRPVLDAPVLAPRDVTTIGLMLSRYSPDGRTKIDLEPGKFSLCLGHLVEHKR